MDDRFDPYARATLRGLTAPVEPAQVMPVLPLPDPAHYHQAECASEMVERLASWAESFQTTLQDGEEVGAVLAHFGQALTIHLTGFGYHNPGLVAIYGETPDGRECELLQHFTQVNFLMVRVSVPEGREAYRGSFFPDEGTNASDE